MIFIVMYLQKNSKTILFVVRYVHSIYTAEHMCVLSMKYNLL